MASNARWGHAAALYGTDDENYLFKDSTTGMNPRKNLNFIIVHFVILEKELKVPKADSNHMKTGWWIEFRNVS